MKRLDDASLVKTRFENLRQNRHNYLRITRILKYLNNIRVREISTYRSSECVSSYKFIIITSINFTKHCYKFKIVMKN